MKNKLQKEYESLKISLGLLFGYLAAGTINKYYSNISWSEALSEKTIIFTVSSIGVSIFLMGIIKKNV